MADIQYLNYGDLQIELLALLNNLANQVLDYVGKQSWSNKRKEKFMSAYSDLMNRGILGASNSTGQWVLNVGGDSPIPLDTMSRKDREMYQEAAYFIQQQMASLPTKASLEEKEEIDKSKLPIFDHSTFKKGFLNQVSNDYFGGSNEIKTSSWDEYDKRDDKGIRGRTERAKMLIGSLERYALNLELNKDKYNFEGSPFGSLDEFKNRIAAARKALIETPDDTDDDFRTLNALGLDASEWFNNGSGDTFVADDGKEYTYGDYYGKVLPALKKEEAKLATAKKLAEIKAYNANLIGGLRWYGKGLTGSPLSPENSNLKYLNQLAAKDSWNGDELSQLVGVFKLAQRNNALENLSKEELATFGPRLGSNPNRFKKIRGLNGIYWDSLLNQIAKPYARGQLNSGVNFLNILDLNNPEKLKEKLKEQAAKNMNTPISQMTEWSPEMKKEMEAIGWDIASIIDPEAFSGSAMALYASHLRDEANPNRGTLEKWLDRGTAALGGILGVGDLLVTGKLGYRLYRLGKSMGSVSKFAGMLGAGFGAIGAYEARDSIMKLSNPSSLTPLDIENISYGFMGLIGLKSFAKARNKLTIGKQANPTIAEHNITINDKNGTHVIKVDEATTKEINNSYKFGRNNKTKSDAKTFNHEKVKKAVEEYNKNPENTKKIDLESASIQSSSKFGITTEKPVKTKYVRDPNAPEYAPIGTRWYNPFEYMAQGNNKWGLYLGGGWQRKAWESAIPELSSKGLWLRTKEFWNPEPRPIQLESIKTSEAKSTETPKATKTKPFTAKEIRELKENIKEFNKYTEGTAKHSGNNLSEESFKAGDFNFEINKFPNSSAGNVDISFNGNNKTISFKNLEDLMKKVALFLKENRKIISTNGSIKKIDAKKMGEILKQLKAKGVFKEGGKIDKQRIQKYKEFINK